MSVLCSFFQRVCFARLLQATILLVAGGTCVCKDTVSQEHIPEPHLHQAPVCLHCFLDVCRQHCADMDNMLRGCVFEQPANSYCPARTSYVC